MNASAPRSPCRVVMFQRRPLAGQHSIERVFADVRSALPPDVDVATCILPFESRGLIKRLRNMLFVWRQRGDVNHITGDVHYVALVLPKRSTVLTVLDLVSVNRLSGVRRLLFVLFWYRLPVRRCGLVTVISEWTRSELVSLLPNAEGKTVVVPCPVSPGFRPSPLQHQNPTVVLQVGTSANKNLQRVVEAVSGLPIRMRIVGHLNGTQLESLSASSVEFTCASLLTVEEMAAEYTNCDIVMFASTYEGFGLPILEAQASGRPIITSSVASMPEVAHGGALLVDPLNVGEIREAVYSLISDPLLCHSLVERGFKNVERFSPQAIASAYATIYRSACSRAGLAAVQRATDLA